MDCARVAPLLLPHVCLLLMLYSGACLATAARLKWDPSTYVLLRELLPAEYRVLCGALLAAAIALAALAHLPAAALAARPVWRRRLLWLHAGGMVTLLVTEISVAWWAADRVSQWLNSDQAAQVKEALELREHIRPILEYLTRWHPLPERLQEIIKEVQEDLPRNGYCAIGAAVALLVLQVAAAVLALLAARTRPKPAHVVLAANGCECSKLCGGLPGPRGPKGARGPRGEAAPLRAPPLTAESAAPYLL